MQQPCATPRVSSANHEQLRGFSERTMSVPAYHPSLVYIDTITMNVNKRGFIWQL